MKILQMMADGSPGGGSTHILQILKGLNKNFSFGLVTQKDSYLQTESCALGIPTFGADFFRSRIDPIVPIRLRQIMAKFQPDLIHVHGSRAGFAYFLSGIRKPMVYTVHGHHFPHKNVLMKSLAVQAERKVAGLARHVIFVCRHDLSIAEAANLLPPETVRGVIYCGIHCEIIPAAKGSERRRLGFVGRLVEQKDPLLFLDCVEMLPGYEASLVGGGKLENKVKTEIARRGLCNVTMLGSLPRRETLRAFSQCAVLVITSRWEGLPILSLEAMCAGIPLVAVDVGGIGEAIEDGRSGVLVRNRSAKALADAVRRVAEDESFRTSVIANARKRVRELFSEDRMFLEIRKIYQSAC